MISDEIIKSLLDDPVEEFASRWLLDCVPFIFSGSAISYWRWRAALARMLSVDPKNLLILGSAATGLSLSPHKRFRQFHEDSDIDVAMIDHYHFDAAWNALRTLGTRVYDLAPAQRTSLEEHRTKYVYWGTIATDKLLPLFPFGQPWQRALDAMSQLDPTRGRDVKIRLYRDYSALSAYLAQGLSVLRNAQLRASVGQQETDK